jgi:hypothetical protein
VREAFDYLQRGRAPTASIARPKTEVEGGLILGRFGSMSVSLFWDDEVSARCFLVVGPRARSTFRVTLGAEDVRALVEALGQAVKDLPESRSTEPTEAEPR